MDLKLVGLFVILGMISENVEARHLSGERFPPLFGSREFPFSRPFGNFQTGTPGFGQAGLPLQRTRRLARFPELGRTSGSGSFSVSPFRSQFGRSPFSSRVFSGLSDLNPLRSQIGRFGRLSSRRNPAGSALRRRISTQFTGVGTRTPPFTYYTGQIPLSRSLSRGRTVSRDIISRLRQRFGSTTGTGTRDDPIRIQAPFASTSGTLTRGARPQLRQGIRQPVRRVSGSETRRVQLSRARQPLESRQQEEVLALFGFDQPSAVSSGLPTLSETIDRQVQVSRTPIKKSTPKESKAAKVPSKSLETKAQKSGNISDLITDAFLQKLNMQQLEKLANVGVAEITKTKSAHTTKHVDIVKDSRLHAGVHQAKNVTTPSEIKRVSQISEKQTISSEAIKTTSTVNDVTKTAMKVAAAKTSVDTIISDADSVTINVNATSNTSVDTGHTGNAPINDNIASAIKHIAELPETVGHISEPVAIYAENSHVALPADTSAVDPAGISVISDKIVQQKTAEIVLPVETVASSEIIVPVESTPSAEIVIPAETTLTSEIVLPVESSSLTDISLPADSISTSEVVVPAESVSSEIIVPVETAPSSDIIVPVETAPSSEIIVSVEKVSQEAVNPASEIVVTPGSIASETVVPVETTPTSEIIVPAEIVSSETFVPASEIVTSVDSASTSELVVPVESVSSEIIVPVEIAATPKVVPVESVSSKAIVPVETTLTSEAVVSESVPSTITARVETSPASEIVETAQSLNSKTILSTETVTTSEMAVPIETAASTKILVPVETNYVAETVNAIPNSETVSLIENSLPSEITLPVETSSADQINIASDSVVPAETVIISETIIPAEKVNAVVDTKPQTNDISSEVALHLETSSVETKTNVLS